MQKLAEAWNRGEYLSTGKKLEDKKRETRSS